MYQPISQTSNAVIMQFSKFLKWTFIDSLKKTTFLFTLIKFSKKYLKKQPKFIHFDEVTIKSQLKLDDSFLSKAEKDDIGNLVEKEDKSRKTMIESLSDEGYCIVI